MRFAFICLISLCSLVLHVTSYGQSDTLSDGLIVTPLDKFVSFNYLYQDPSAKISLNTSASWDVREVPGNIMVYVSEDIIATGATDLIDFLQFVPGFNTTLQMDQTAGIAIRGIPGNDGRVLVSLNGLPLNEVGTGSLPLIQRINLRNVARIEITYGPGNIVSGSGASLASVNVIMKNANDSESAEVSGLLSTFKNGLALSGAHISANHFIGKGATLNYSFRRSNGFRNEHFNQAKNGPFLSIDQDSRVTNAEAFVLLDSKNYRVGYFESAYSPGYSPSGYKIQSHSRTLDLSHALIGKNSFSLRNKLCYTQQSPWHYGGVPDSLYSLNNISYNKTTFASILTYNFRRTLYISSVFEASRTTMDDEFNLEIPAINKNNWFKNDPSVYTGVFGLDLLLTSRIGLFNIAARAEWGTLNQKLISPRFSYTRLKGRIHFKFVAAQNFRVPEIKNFVVTYPGDSIMIEKLNSVQIQSGYNINNKHKILINCYYSQLLNPVRHFVGNGVDIYYRNLAEIASYGVEFNYELNLKNILFGASYSINEVLSDPSLRTNSDTILIAANNLFGSPVNILNIRSNWKLSERSSITISSLFHGQKKYTVSEYTNKTSNQKIDPSVILNIFYRAKMTNSGRVQLEVGVLNIFDQKQYLHNYNEELTDPLPFSTRQYRVSLSYALIK
jgi:outer membrane receptor protein involved in Fe transport